MERQHAPGAAESAHRNATGILSTLQMSWFVATTLSLASGRAESGLVGDHLWLARALGKLMETVNTVVGVARELRARFREDR